MDVGYGLLDYNLRKDPRVQVLERVNFRHFDPATLSATPQLAVIDVSFISLAKILPVVSISLPKDITVLALVKPQFEGTPKEVPGGFVKDEPTRALILSRVRNALAGLGFELLGEMESAVKGRKGNQESFFLLKPL